MKAKTKVVRAGDRYFVNHRVGDRWRVFLEHTGGWGYGRTPDEATERAIDTGARGYRTYDAARTAIETDGKFAGLKGAVMAKKKNLGLFARTKKAASKRVWTSVSSGKTAMYRVPRGCAIVQSGEKKGKVRRGCKLTKNGAYCAGLTQLPETAKIGPALRRKDGRKRRRVVKCPDLT